MNTKSLRLIEAVASGDAQREDVVRAFKDEGIDAVDLLVDVLAGASRKPARPSRLGFFSPDRKDRPRFQSVHNVPYYPFVLNGILYDPADIKRFDGQELHFVGSGVNSEILAIDDRDVVDLWARFTYIEGIAKTAMQSDLAGARHGIAISTANSPQPRPFPDLPTPDGPVGPGLTPGYGGPPRTIFFEHSNYGGNDFDVKRNRGYSDLTEVSWTFFGTGDWNDEISSFVTTIPLWTRLWEHTGWTGSSYTVHGGSLDLTPVGWNDRASGVETW